MSGPATSRREFLRLAALGALGVAAGCSSDAPTAGPSDTPSVAGSATPTSSPKPPLEWRKLRAEGPSARRDHTLTGVEGAKTAVLFGGRHDGAPLGDTWIFDASDGWTRVRGDGPSPRFGHNAGWVESQVILFGGQGKGSDFFNDVWSFDLEKRRWTEVAVEGAKPGVRYGASSAADGLQMLISHGFNFDGRFADTRQLVPAGPAWRDLTPEDGPAPIKRCLHRSALTRDGFVLFGGQTNGTPYLGDTWILEDNDRWREVEGKGPGARNLFAAASDGKDMVIFGGFGAGGTLDDVWSFQRDRWKKLTPRGEAPSARGGIEGAYANGDRMLVFGGNDGSKDLADLWELALPT